MSLHVFIPTRGLNSQYPGSDPYCIQCRYFIAIGPWQA